jgi:hypothetical protein
MTLEQDSYDSAQLLGRLFSDSDLGDYCLLKISPSFPYVGVGSDIDLLCRDPHAFIDAATRLWLDQRTTNKRLKIKPISATHIHVDLLAPHLILRLDLYVELPSFGAVSFRRDFTQHVICNRTGKVISAGTTHPEFTVFIPETVDDLVIRLAEYAAYFWTGPDKVHHVDALLDAANLNRNDALERIHDWIAPIELQSHDRLTNYSDSLRTRLRSLALLLALRLPPSGSLTKFAQSPAGRNLRRLIQRARTQ